MSEKEWYVFRCNEDEALWHHRHGTVEEAMSFVRALNRILHNRGKFKARLMTDDEIRDGFLGKEEDYGMTDWLGEP